MESIWTVFIAGIKPNKKRETGFLFGTINQENKSVCVLDVNQNGHCDNELQLIGKQQSFYPENLDKNEDVWVIIIVSDFDLVDCSVYVKSERMKCTCVLYDPQAFQESYLFLEKSHSAGGQQIVDDSLSGNIQQSVIEDVCHSLKFTNSPKKQIFDCSLNFVFKIVQIIVRYLGIMALSEFLVNCSQILYKRMAVGLAQGHVMCPSFLSQMKRRVDVIRTISEYHKQTPIMKLRYQNRIWNQIVDCLVGILLLMLIWQFDLHNKMVNFTLQWTHDIAGKLIVLIHWLMGAPAGLKLNVQLTQLMGQFFLYHIDLWTGYVALVQPILSSLVYLSIPISILGLSFQLSLLQDIVSMLTLHIYCFYVYAARIYSMEISAVAALWRLFRGKKWNILRERVDSASYDVDQLFFGTLILTILVFLLPTIILYYLVFLTLRFIVLSIQGILSLCVQKLNTVQIYTIVAWILKSNSISGSVIFNVVPCRSLQQSKYCLVLSMETAQLPLKTIFEITKDDDISEDSTCSLSLIFSKVLNGKLLFPWNSSSLKEKQE
ncbi:hypothetical protein SNE40_020233 [Patella caerulea]|uniref:Phosphatidylinositol N-acetylglucosaminyltransferase subunit Q n=1 Tax=Patella caerulea TaxID=87958 RepID=A0AAN8GAG9_PATCE